MKICWISARADAHTGYGLQSKEIISRILKSGNHKVWNLGGLGGNTVWGGKTTIPVKEHGVEIPTLVTCGDMTGAEQIDLYIQLYKFDAAVTLWDVFVVKWVQDLKIPSIIYFPIDAPFTNQMWQCVKNAYKLVTYSKFGYNEMLKWAPPSKLSYIPHGMDTNLYKPASENEKKSFRDKIKVPDDAFMIVDAGANVGERKQIPLLMLIFKEFLKTHPDSYLYLFTNPVMAFPQGYDLLGFGDQLGIRGRLRFPDVDPLLEPWKNEDLATLYSAADVYCTTSIGEGFALPLAEALSCGTPAITTNCSAMTELTEGHGWLIDTVPDYHFIPCWIPTLQVYPVPSETSTLTHLNDAYNNRDKAKTYGKAAREFMVKNYDWSVVFPQWEKLLAEVDDERRFFREITRELM